MSYLGWLWCVTFHRKQHNPAPSLLRGDHNCPQTSSQCRDDKLSWDVTSLLCMWGPVYIQLRVPQFLSSIENLILVCLINLWAPNLQHFLQSLCHGAVHFRLLICHFRDICELWVVYEMLRIQSSFRYGREDKESRSNEDLLPTFWLHILGQDRDPSSHPAFVYLWNGKTNNTWVVCHVLSTQEIQNWWVFLPQDYTSFSIPP